MVFAMRLVGMLGILRGTGGRGACSRLRRESRTVCERERERRKRGEEEKDGKKRKTGGGSKKVEAKMRRRAPGVAENRGK